MIKNRLKIMSEQKSIPKGLCDQEVKRGHIKKPSIPYIPIEDEIRDRVKYNPGTFKVKMEEKTTVNMSVWLRGNQENFLVHAIVALNYCVRTNLFNKWKSAKKAKNKHYKELVEISNYLHSLDQVQETPTPAEPNKEPKENPPLL